MAKTKAVSLDAIEVDGCQSRASTNAEAVEDYAQAWRDGEVFPPVVLFTDGSAYWPGDGIHRILAAKKAERSSISAVVENGGADAARLYGASRLANGKNGMRRTRADVRKSIGIVLAINPKWSDRRVAEHVGASQTTVGAVRSELSKLDSSLSPATRVGEDGKERKIPQRKPAVGPGERLIENSDGSFDVAEIEAAPPKPKSKPKQGTPRVSTELRKAAQDSFGKLCRALQAMGIYDQYLGHLDQIQEGIKDA